MSWNEGLSALLFALGTFFFLGGTAGLLRLPDTFSRLHALTKADNVGLGLITAGAMLVAGNAWDIGKLALVWLIVLIGSATSGYLVARHARAAAAAGRKKQ